MNTKSKLIVLLGVSLLVVFALVVSHFIVPEETQTATTEKDGLSAVTLTPLSADVSVNVTPEEEAGWQVVSNEIPAEDGTGIRTSVAGRAIVTHDAQIITSLNSNSEIVLSVNDAKTATRIELLRGQMWAKIERALEQDEMYGVYTPTMVAAVRGTSFGVTVDQQESLMVSEGVVAVWLRDPETGDAIADTEVLVQAGEIVTVIDGALVVRRAIDDDFDDWYREHTDREDSDAEIAEQPDTPPGPAAVRSEPAATPSSPAAAAEPEPQPAESKPLAISEIRPTEFHLKDRHYVAIAGSGLDRVTEVFFDGDSAPFQFTSTGVLAAFVSEISGDGVFTVTITDGESTVEVKDAFTVLPAAEEPSAAEAELRIASVSIPSTAENEPMRISGAGFTGVDTVLLDGQAVQFAVVSDEEIEVFDFFGGDFSTVRVSGAGQSATYSP